MLRLHDTAFGQVRPLAQRDPGKVSIYVCGPTVYDLPHIGHGRQVLVYDVLRRYLEWTGVDVHHVSNVTDVDDNIIKRAGEEGRSADEVVAHYEQEWWAAVDGLGALRPHDTPHATAYITGMIDLVDSLVHDEALAIQRSAEDGERRLCVDHGANAERPIETGPVAKIGAHFEHRYFTFPRPATGQTTSTLPFLTPTSSS